MRDQNKIVPDDTRKERHQSLVGVPNWLCYVALRGCVQTRKKNVSRVEMRYKQIFQKSRNFLRILGTKQVACSKFQTEDPQTAYKI